MEIHTKKLFTKTLSQTDVEYRMAIPMSSLKAFAISDGKRSKQVDVVDFNGKVWSFGCSTRKSDPYPKPVISSGWTQYVKDRCLKPGDQVSFYLVGEDGAKGPRFKIEARKKVRLLGEDIWSTL